MADFPTTVKPRYSSSEQWRDPILPDFSKSGAFRGRRLQPAKKRTFVLAFRGVSESEKDTLETHYDAHRNVTFNFTPPDGSGPYTVAYGAEVTWAWSKYDWFEGTVVLVEA